VPQAGQGIPVIVLKKQLKDVPVHRYVIPTELANRIVM
jgi:hypothetical protein